MKSKGRSYLLVPLSFLLGAALPALLLWNPGRWQWADRLVTRLHRPSTTEKQQPKRLWTCGMHPQVIQEEPGNCPICEMKLVPVRSTVVGSEAGGPQTKERKIKYWRAPMDPNYISDKPGKSPMGMDLVPVYEDEESVVTGIRVDPNFLQNFAVRTALVEKGAIPVEIRTIGILGYNEKNITSVSTKFEGWIEKARVNYIGETVRRGQVLFEVYSPQLVTTQQEYLATLDYLERLSSGAHPDAVERARALLEAARQRLRYWDITDEQITQLSKSGKARRTLQIVSPVSGIVVEKMSESLEGMKLAPGINVYKIADLSTVWANIELFESQIQYLRLGLRARIQVEAFPTRRWTGRIIYIAPSMNPETRTLRASIEMPNPGWNLRPEMYADVKLEVPTLSSAIRVPEEAILHSGERSVVIVEKGKGVFEPREVELGAAGGGYRQVRRGLQPSEVVVTSSQFLIDSESNLREAISKLFGGRGGEAAEPIAPKPAQTHPH